MIPRVRVALIHDWLTGMRGGEKALEVFCELFPTADLFTLVYLKGTVTPMIERRAVKRSPIQWLPFAGKLYRQYLPLFPMAVEQFDLDDYDLVISTSHCAAKSVVVTGRARHLCYCLTPMRYAWDQFDAYFGPERVGTMPSALLRPVLAGLARWDRATDPGDLRPDHHLTHWTGTEPGVGGQIGSVGHRQQPVPRCQDRQQPAPTVRTSRSCQDRGSIDDRA